ncbi:MAG TPA: redoxin domain-containing protein [Anaeromyxobacter sp.]|nr:redoxin domain-containing protein [Anaeromyxobacter sp.]
MQRRRLVTLAAAGIAGFAGGVLPVPARGSDRTDRRIQIGDAVPDVQLDALEGGKGRLLAKGVKANVFVFFRLEQERSVDTLRDLAACEKEFASKPVRFVGIVSDAWPADQVRALVKDTGVKMTVLVDKGDELYGALGIRLHPVIGMVDQRGKLAAFEPFRQINYCERVRVRIRFLLGEVSEAEIAKVDEPERSPLPHSAEGVAKRHLNFARMLLKIGEHDKALDEVQKGLAAGPSAAAYALQGEILAAKGRCPDAVRAFDAALKIEPTHSVATEGKKRCTQ